MEREVLYRGKSIIEGDDKWYYGSLIVTDSGEYVIRYERNAETNYVVVYKETVGALVTRTASGEPIFEGDVVTLNTKDRYLVYYDNGCFSFIFKCIDQKDGPKKEEEFKKIAYVGNIIDSDEYKALI